MTYNFSAGPATLPKEVLLKAQQSLLEYKHTGSSILSLSHRSSYFIDILDNTRALLRKLMHIPEDYNILFMQGGATTQFATIPMNLLHSQRIATYVDTGVWASKAAAIAQHYGKVEIPYSSQENNYTTIPDLSNAEWNTASAYVHITTNNTIYGTCYSTIPNTGAIPLVADMSSDILSKSYKVTDFDVIYAGAQKNLGPAGLAIVIIKNTVSEAIPDSVPGIFNYKTFIEHQSLYHTPNTFAIYVGQLVLQWLDELGGVAAIHDVNLVKASMLYDFLDNSKLFKAAVPPGIHRSIMNIPFSTGCSQTDEAFIKYAQDQGLLQLKGHRTNGGMRASLYNAMPIEGVQKLIHTLQDFELGKR